MIILDAYLQNWLLKPVPNKRIISMNDKKISLKRSLVIGMILVTGTGCVSTKQVVEIVNSSNAMVASSALMVPGKEAEPDEWQRPVAELDLLIRENQNQPKLVNQLRFRQALILTVNQQNNLATARWKQVNFELLENERDIGLFQNRKALIWWYKRAPDFSRLEAEDAKMAREFVDSISQKITSDSNSDLKFFLGTIRAQMEWRLANEAEGEQLANPQEISSGIASSLDNYLSLFSEADKSWLRSESRRDLNGVSSLDARNIADFRRRVSLSTLVKDFCVLHCDLDVPRPLWRPLEWDWKKICPEKSFKQNCGEER